MVATLRRELGTRKARFRAALALARMTAREWTEREDCTETHLYAVLKGTRNSSRLLAKIDAFIAKHLDGAAA